MEKWTRGPWTPGIWQIEEPIEEPHEDRGLVRIAVFDWDADDYGRSRYSRSEIARIEDTEHEQANAHLIAAAPDLYKELEHLVRLMEPLEQDGALKIPGVATLNGARAALAKARGENEKAEGVKS